MVCAHGFMARLPSAGSVMSDCIARGLTTDGTLPGGLAVNVPNF
ncbi:hypothetical protein RGUI_1214 [Rhodovulum sp. P5]|nr:hypothetical protein RGUI_1214 [Rhodovulum sp. P5]